MKAGDIIFVRGKSPISKLIQYFDRGEFSHVAMAVSDTHILEAQYLTTVHIKEFYFEDYEIINMALTDAEQYDVLRFGISLVGKKYDYLQIVWYVVENILKLKRERMWNSPNNLICSEVISNVLLLLGKISKDDFIKGMTPNELYLFLTQQI